MSIRASMYGLLEEEQELHETPLRIRINNLAKTVKRLQSDSKIANGLLQGILKAFGDKLEHGEITTAMNALMPPIEEGAKEDYKAQQSAARKKKRGDTRGFRKASHAEKKGRKKLAPGEKMVFGKIVKTRSKATSRLRRKKPGGSAIKAKKEFGRQDTHARSRGKKKQRGAKDSGLFHGKKALTKFRHDKGKSAL
jgi:hypothetical protein